MEGKENSAMTILMDFAKPCKGKLIGSVVLAVLGAFCGMIPYIAVSRGIIMICHEDYAFSKLAFLALIALAGYLGQVWFGTFSTMKSHESAFIILRNIRMAITEKLSRVPMGTILDTPSGKFKTIIVDTVEKLELPLAHMVPELTANILIPILMLVYLFSLDWRLALISLVTIPVGAFCYMGMMKDYEKRYARVLAAGKNMDAATVEYIGGIEVVKTFNQGERSYKKYADAVAENETAKATWFKQTNGYYVMGLSILTATLVGVLPLGSWLFINGRVEAGTLITCIILALGLVKPLIQALQYTDSLAMVDSTVKEVGNLLDEPELVRPTERAVLADADVSFDHVTFRYKETEVLHGISFDCAKNGMTAIVGPSGSGKSTIARLIASFWEAESGGVRIGGVDVRNIPLPQIMELVSYVSQDNFLFHLSIRENIRIIVLCKLKPWRNSGCLRKFRRIWPRSWTFRPMRSPATPRLKVWASILWIPSKWSWIWRSSWASISSLRTRSRPSASSSISSKANWTESSLSRRGAWQGCTTWGDSGALLPAIRYSGEEFPTEGVCCVV